MPLDVKKTPVSEILRRQLFFKNNNKYYGLSLVILYGISKYVFEKGKKASDEQHGNSFS